MGKTDKMRPTKRTDQQVRVQKAGVGMQFWSTIGFDRYKKPPEKWELMTVQPACSEKGGQGHWLCATHGEALQHNLAKDSHLSRHEKSGATCFLVWFCYRHGAEVP